jgi:hypothetical protein
MKAPDGRVRGKRGCDAAAVLDVTLGMTGATWKKIRVAISPC